MSSANKTPNLELNLWDITDPVMHSDFNADNEKIDLAVQGLDSKFTSEIANLDSGIAAQITALSENIETELGARLKIITGSYVGTGTYGKENPTTLYTGIKPYIVILSYEGSLLGHSITRPFTDLHVLVPWSVFFNLNANDTTQYRAHITEWELDHISWYSSSSASYAANLSGGTYRYLIIGTDS